MCAPLHSVVGVRIPLLTVAGTRSHLTVAWCTTEPEVGRRSVDGLKVCLQFGYDDSGLVTI